MKKSGASVVLLLSLALIITLFWGCAKTMTYEIRIHQMNTYEDIRLQLVNGHVYHIELMDVTEPDSAKDIYQTVSEGDYEWLAGYIGWFGWDVFDGGNISIHCDKYLIVYDGRCVWSNRNE